MNYIDKTNSLAKIEQGNEKIILELGCGNTKTYNNSIALDIVDLKDVDIVCDLNNGFPFIPDNSVDEVHSTHFMEHTSDVGFMMKEIHRVLKINGKNEITVPHFSSPYYYSDYTHKNPFGIYSMSYFSKQSYFKRKVPVFYNDIDFKITNVSIKLKSRWLLTRLFFKTVHLMLNSNKTMLEFYEAHCCYLMPASEITFSLQKQ